MLRWLVAAVITALYGAKLASSSIANVDVVAGAGLLMPLSANQIRLGALGRMRSRGAWYISYEPPGLPPNVTSTFRPDQGSSPIPIPTARLSLVASSYQGDAATAGLLMDAVTGSSVLCDGYLASASQLLQPARYEWDRGFNSSQGPFRVDPFDVPVSGDKGLGGSGFVLSVVSCSPYPVRVTGTVDLVWPSITNPFHGLVSLSGDVSPIQGQVDKDTGVISMPHGPSIGARVNSHPNSVWRWVHSSPAHEHRPLVLLAFLVIHTLGLVYVLLRILLPGWELRLEQSMQLAMMSYANWLDPDSTTDRAVIDPFAHRTRSHRPGRGVVTQVRVAESVSGGSRASTRASQGSVSDPPHVPAPRSTQPEQEATRVARTAPYNHTSPDEINSMLALSNRTIVGELLVILTALTYVISLLVSLVHHIELRETGAPSAVFTSTEQVLRGLARSLLIVVLGSVGGFWHSGRPGSSGVVGLFMVGLVGGGAVVGISTELCIGSSEIVVAVPVPLVDGSEWLSCDVLSIFDLMLRVFAELALYAATVWRMADIATAIRAPWRSQLSMLVLLRRYWRLQRVQDMIIATIFGTVFGLLVSGITVTWKGSLVATVYFTVLDMLVWSVAVMAAMPESDQAGGLSGCLSVLCHRRCPGLCACYRHNDGDPATSAQFGGMKQYLRATSMGPIGLLEAIRVARERYHDDHEAEHD